MGSNARCLSVVSGFRSFITDYITPPSQVLKRDLHKTIDQYSQFLHMCRPLISGVQTAIKYLLQNVSSIPVRAGVTDSHAKQWLLDKLDNFVTEKLVYSIDIIVENGLKHLMDGDVILTFGRTTSVEQIIIQGHKAGKKFKVIVAEGRGDRAGRQMMQKFANMGINCVYTLTHSIMYFIKNITKVHILYDLWKFR